MATPMLAGDGSYSFEIVGEGRYQAELESICGGARPNIEQECLALLIADPDDDSDTPDVRVEINGRRVGNLSRSDAAAYGEAIHRLQWDGDALACRALISSDQRSYFGVELDLMWPLRLGAEADEPLPQERHAPIRPRRWRSVFRALLLMVLLVAAVAAALWYLPPPTGQETVGAARQPATPATPGGGFAPPGENAGAPVEDASPGDVAAPPAAASATPAQGPCPDEATAARAWEIVRNSGVVTSMSSTGDISVNGTVWDGLPQEDRMRFAMAGYCRSVKADGSGAMLIVGSEDGKLRGSIVNGAWLDPVR